MANWLGPNATLQALAGTALTTAYTTMGAALNVGRADRVYFWVNVVLAGGSPITSVSMKMQTRYTDGTVSLAYIDIQSVNAATGMSEIAHIFNVGAPATGSAFLFYLDGMRLMDTTLNLKVNATGIAGDSVTAYVVLA